MWYNTDYNGKITIKPEPTATVLTTLQEAIRKAHPESHWNLRLWKDFCSIVWRGCEKTYNFEDSLNAVEKYMTDRWFDFTLEWEFEYQWEESDDRWYVRKVDWVFVRIEKKLEADEYKCPDCWHIFKPNK